MSSALEFRTASDERMARDNAGEAPQETLFHYTSEEAFRNIVRTEQLWFTSIYQMDDREELNFGYGISRSILQSVSDSGDVVIRAFCEPLIRDDLRADIRQTFDFYSVSFGTKDDPNQWSRYADGGKGLAIGLAPPFFLPQQVVDPKPEDHVYVGKVLYGDKAARAKHAAVVDFAIDVIGQVRDAGLIRKWLDARAFFRRIASEMYVEILWNCVTTKDDSWSQQRETRLLALNHLGKPHLEIHNATVRPRVQIGQPLLRSNLEEVMLGPMSDASAEDRIKTFLIDHGLTETRVTRSSFDHAAGALKIDSR